MFKYNTSIERHKIFITGLPFSCTKEQLEELCRSYGTIKDVRLVTYRSGKPKVRRRRQVQPADLTQMSRFGRRDDGTAVMSLGVSLQGLAYVEFADEAQASQAVQKMDGIDVEGNKISVAISNPPRRNPMDKAGSSRADLMPRQVYGA